MQATSEAIFAVQLLLQKTCIMIILLQGFLLTNHLNNYLVLHSHIEVYKLHSNTRKQTYNADLSRGEFPKFLELFLLFPEDDLDISLNKIASSLYQANT